MLPQRRQKTGLPVLCALLAFLLSLAGCTAGSSATPRDVVRAMCDAEKPLPAGRLYVLSAPEDSEEHPSASLLAATFGDGAPAPEMENVADAAFFLSYSHPCELAAFLCKTADGTDAVAEMCLRRLDVLKNIRSDGDTAAYAENATVTVSGRWVILCVSSDPAAALRAFRRTL